MTINACKKGKAGERELAHFLREHGIEAKRGQQHAGGADSPDVRADLPGWHIECKRVENLNVHNAFAQADRDRDADKLPLVAHRRNRGEWMATIRLSDLLKLLRTEQQEACAGMFD